MIDRFKNENIIIPLLILGFLSGAFFTFSVEYYNGLSFDDLHFAAKLKNLSIFAFAKDAYINHGGQFFWWLISGMTIKSVMIFDSVVPAGVFFYFLNICFVFWGLKNFLSNINLGLLLGFSALIFQLYIFSMFHIGSYFWICTKPYTLVTTLTFWSLSTYKKHNISRFEFALLVIGVILISSNSVSLSPLVIMFIGGDIIYNFFYRKIVRGKTIIIFLIAVISFIFYFIAPSNFKRLEYTNNVENIAEMFYYSLHNIKTIAIQTTLKIIYFFQIVLLLGYLFDKGLKGNLDLLKKNLYKNYIIIFTVIISILIVTYAVSDGLPLRAFNHVNFLIVFFLFNIFYLNYLKKTFIWGNYKVVIVITCLAIVIIINTLYFFWNINNIKQYSELNIARIEYLLELQRNGNKMNVKLTNFGLEPYQSIENKLGKKFLPTLSTKPLIVPYSISSDTAFYTNQDIRNYYELDFSVYSEDDFDWP